MKRVSAHARTRQGEGAGERELPIHCIMYESPGWSISVTGMLRLFVTFVHFTVPFRLIKFYRFCDLLQSLCVYLIFITLVVIF